MGSVKVVSGDKVVFDIGFSGDHLGLTSDVEGTVMDDFVSSDLEVLSLNVELEGKVLEGSVSEVGVSFDDNFIHHVDVLDSLVVESVGTIILNNKEFSHSDNSGLIESLAFYGVVEGGSGDNCNVIENSSVSLMDIMSLNVVLNEVNVVEPTHDIAPMHVNENDTEFLNISGNVIVCMPNVSTSVNVNLFEPVHNFEDVFGIKLGIASCRVSLLDEEEIGLFRRYGNLNLKSLMR